MGRHCQITLVWDPYDAPMAPGMELSTDEVICMVDNQAMLPGTIIKRDGEYLLYQSGSFKRIQSPDGWMPKGKVQRGN